MKVAYVFSTANSHTILSRMIVPQLENNAHVAEVAGMFFFRSEAIGDVDNTHLKCSGKRYMSWKGFWVEDWRTWQSRAIFARGFL